MKMITTPQQPTKEDPYSFRAIGSDGAQTGNRVRLHRWKDGKQPGIDLTGGQRLD